MRAIQIKFTRSVVGKVSDNNAIDFLAVRLDSDFGHEQLSDLVFALPLARFQSN